jgi:hypothetical protein
VIACYNGGLEFDLGAFTDYAYFKLVDLGTIFLLRLIIGLFYPALFLA